MNILHNCADRWRGEADGSCWSVGAGLTGVCSVGLVAARRASSETSSQAAVE